MFLVLSLFQYRNETHMTLIVALFYLQFTIKYILQSIWLQSSLMFVMYKYLVIYV